MVCTAPGVQLPRESRDLTEVFLHCKTTELQPLFSALPHRRQNFLFYECVLCFFNGEKNLTNNRVKQLKMLNKVLQLKEESCTEGEHQILSSKLL